MAVASSYSDFISLSRADSRHVEREREISSPEHPDVDALMFAAEQLAGTSIDVIAVDMPMAHGSIVGRRLADQRVSKEFGGRGCSTHSPNRFRPGEVGRRLMKGLERHGFELATRTKVPDGKALIEVYPHPALLSLMRTEMRLPYKVGKLAKIDRGQTKAQRIKRLCTLYAEILSELSHFIEVDPSVFLGPKEPEITHLSSLKSYEDCIDALICAWVGILYVEGKTVQMGGDGDAICVPRDVVRDV